ncbi:hypothetical protein [Streptomyces sp. NPDC048419]|uniref:hypothetical protein n=1 Tax=Streptomyces sp. NPDC048419 TaxID=3365547 RepID=UPI00371BAC16
MVGDAQGTHFWFITLQAPSPAGLSFFNYQGTVTPGRDNTRLDVFNEIRKDLVSRFPHLGKGVVLAFDVQPNRLFRPTS